jgi:hypothetical protein
MSLASEAAITFFDTKTAGVLSYLYTRAKHLGPGCSKRSFVIAISASKT